MSAQSAEAVRHWKGMTLRDQLLEWRERALEAEAERDRLRDLLAQGCDHRYETDEDERMEADG